MVLVVVIMIGVIITTVIILYVKNKVAMKVSTVIKWVTMTTMSQGTLSLYPIYRRPLNMFSCMRWQGTREERGKVTSTALERQH